MKHLTLLGLVFFACSANAAWIGQYVKPNEMTLFQKPVVSELHDYRYFYQSAVCIDTSERAVPGKTWNNKCYVEWDGKEYSNSDFKLLVNEGYTWERLTSSNESMLLSRGVTPGKIDAGNYVYHCRIEDTLRDTLAIGKYIPSHKKCYYGYKGKSYAPTSVARFEILIK